MEDYLRLLKEHGIQIVRVFVPGGVPGAQCSSYGGGLEYELGKYDDKYLIYFDKLFKIASNFEIYVIFALFDAYKFNVCWNKTPYSRFGPSSESFFKPAARDFQKKRVHLLVQRYSKDHNLLDWEPINEINNVCFDILDGDHRLLEWFEDIAKTIRKYDYQTLIT